jgi:hypothetical protein
MIIFLIRRSLFLVVFIPHEDFTPQKNVHSSMWGSAGGVTPPAGSRVAIPLAGGSGGKQAPDGGSGAKPRRKKCLVKVYCNFIVNLDYSL